MLGIIIDLKLEINPYLKKNFFFHSSRVLVTETLTFQKKKKSPGLRLRVNLGDS